MSVKGKKKVRKPDTSTGLLGAIMKGLTQKPKKKAKPKRGPRLGGGKPIKLRPSPCGRCD